MFGKMEKKINMQNSFERKPINNFKTLCPPFSQIIGENGLYFSGNTCPLRSGICNQAEISKKN